MSRADRVSPLSTLGGLFGALLIGLLVVPLVFVSLVCGSTSLGDSARMGPIAVKTLLFYLGTTAIAVSSALLIAVSGNHKPSVIAQKNILSHVILR